MRSDDASAKPGDPTFTLADLGPLRPLLGTWEGQTGVSVTPLPFYRPVPPDQPPEIEFTLQHEKFNDTLVFEPILGGVANRGYKDAKQLRQEGQEDQFLLGVQYTQTVYRIPDEQRGLKVELLHVESGQLLLNKIPGIDPDWSVTRMALIPHGVSVIAVGTNSTESGDNILSQFQKLGPAPSIMLPSNVGNSQEFPGMVGKYKFAYSGIEDLTFELIKALGDEPSSVNALRLDVSTLTRGGNFASLPHVEAQVQPSDFNSTWWIETFPDKRQQLQYIQSLDFRFQTTMNSTCIDRGLPSSTGCLIRWPHLLTSTLTKTKDYEPQSNANVLHGSVR